MPRQADLHIHTHFSDSTQSPEEVVEQAHQAGLNCIAITDHDTIDGVEPTMKSAEAYGMEVIAGIELSSEVDGKDVHILGYGFDIQNKNFVEQIGRIQSARLGRMDEMIGKLRDLGVENITSQEVCDLAQSDSVGRPHLASILKEKGWVTSNQEAFDKYLADGAPAYVSKFKQSPVEAIQLIQEAGGVAVLAHPMLTKVDELIPDFVKGGLKGIEVYYPNTSSTVKEHYEKIAQKFGLILTGGSDAHGSVKKHTYIGKMSIPYALVEKLKAACAA